MSVVSDTKLMVWWSVPAQSGGYSADQLSYSVQWDTSSAFGNSANQYTVSETSYLIDSLTSGGTYTVRVAAYNAEGYSEYVVAQALVDWSEVVQVTTQSGTSFTLTYDDGRQTETTATIPPYATPEQVQDALLALTSINAVTVERYDFSATYTGIGSYDVWYKIRFIAVQFSANSAILTTTAPNYVTIHDVRDGVAPTSKFVTLSVMAPSAVTNVVTYVVSSTELGVTWEAPLYRGGNSVSKFLVEWDVNPYFARSNNTKYSDVVTYNTAASNNALASFAYQITGLTVDVPIYVRVSAFNGDSSTKEAGYSPATQSWPVNDVSCDTMPVHCFESPASQVLYLPLIPSVDLNAGEVANRLDVTWQQPLYDIHGFSTETTGAHTPDMASSYRIEWAHRADFAKSTFVDLRMITDDDTNVTCHSSCTYTIGQEIQKLTVVSGNDYPLDGGDFALIYIGKQLRTDYVLVRQGSTYVVFMESSVTAPVAGDFLSIAGTIYQIDTVISSTEVTLSEEFNGGFTDIVQAYYAEFPASLLDYDADSAAVDTYLEAQLSSIYASFGSNFEVSRETLEKGYSWYITFTGEMFYEDVEQLLLVAKVSNANFTGGVLDFTTQGTATQLAQAYVTTTTDAGDLSFGESVYVRVSAINDEGMGPSNLCEVFSAGNSYGAIVPRSPPSLPVDVDVWAVPTSEGETLKVTWSEGETFGSAITHYMIQHNRWYHLD